MPTVSMERVTTAIFVADSDILEHHGEVVSYSFARFKNAMLSQGVFYDLRAIKSRWDALKAKRVITEVGPAYSKALFNVPTFNKEFGYRIDTAIPSTACTHTHTHMNDSSVKEW